MKSGEKIRAEYIGLRGYEDVVSIQEACFNELFKEKSESGKSSSPMQLILCQHKPVYTLGRNGDASNLLTTAANSDAVLVKCSRGGDITYHGPGQLVGYPILDLERLGIGLAAYIDLLEESIIHTIAHFGLKGERLKGAAGVWLDTAIPSKTRKICAIGIRSSRWLTMHGFAFNINTDLNYFNYINPCGFTDKDVTSLSKELGAEQDFEKVIDLYVDMFAKVFGVTLYKSREPLVLR